MESITTVNSKPHGSFEMPIVGVTQMEMNESIASACCFSVTTTPLITKKNVHNGGRIDTFSYFEVYPQVIQFFGGIATAPQVHYQYYSPTVDAPAGYNDAAIWVKDGIYYKTFDVAYFSQSTEHTLGSVYIINNGQIENIPVSISGFVAPSSGICNHISAKCPFNHQVSINNAHIGSTTPHLLGGSQWASPHPGAQFNS